MMDRVKSIFGALTPDPTPVIRKFLLCLPVPRYIEGCFCGLFPLRTAICFFAILDLLVGMICGLDFASNIDFSYKKGERFPALASSLLAAIVGLVAVLGLSGVVHTDSRKVSFYYYAKVEQLFGRLILELWAAGALCGRRTEFCDSNYWTIIIIFSGAVFALHYYEALVLFSYVNLVARGEAVLANSGLEVVKVMERVRVQAEIMNAASYSAVARAPAGQLVTEGK